MLTRRPPDELLWLETERMILEPVRQSHANALYELFRDPRLHEFTPYELPRPAEHAESCARRWAICQAGIKDDGIASVAYLVSRAYQGQGFATEGMRAVFSQLREEFGVRKTKAWIDARNARSIRLVERLGMKRGELIKDADFFKGATSDEWVYELEL